MWFSGIQMNYNGDVINENIQYHIIILLEVGANSWLLDPLLGNNR